MLKYSSLGSESSESRCHVMGSQSTTPPLRPKLKKAKGTCSVCHLIRQLHVQDGRVHLHGLRSNPCLGSRRPLLSGAQLTLGLSGHGGDGRQTRLCVVAGSSVDGPSWVVTTRRTIGGRPSLNGHNRFHPSGPTRYVGVPTSSHLWGGIHGGVRERCVDRLTSIVKYISQ